MQHGPTETSSRESHTGNDFFPSPPLQDGSNRFLPAQPGAARSQLQPRSQSPGSALSGGAAASAASPLAPPGRGNDLTELRQGLGRLSIADAADSQSLPIAGHRVSEYEKAVMGSSPRRSPGQSPRRALGFKVVKGPGSPTSGVQLTDFPNELLTQILSHLHPDSHAAVALVSKRFYALVTTPYAWRTAFLRYFPEQDALAGPAGQGPQNSTHSSDTIRSEARYFTRLTSLASWRSEYLLRTRLLRNVARGKPGSIGSSTRSSQSKKSAAVLTYNSKLPWMITNVHADFVGGKRGPRVIHGTAELGIATASDPTTGRVEKWGMDDLFAFSTPDEVVPGLELYGVGNGPAAGPNIMDVSQQYGVVGGEGFPGGRVYFKATHELRGRYLGGDNSNLDDNVAEIPKIPEITQAISSVWIAKSSNVPSTTQSLVGILTGSTLGVVTSYALGAESSGFRIKSGEMTARWVLSPGVPIVDIKVDDRYNQRRKTLGRIWAVALNALGEVFYLTTAPTPPTVHRKADQTVKEAWNIGRTAYWELIESTRRASRLDEFDNDAMLGTYSPRSSPNSMGLSREQFAAEAKEIETFLRYAPAHFRRVCQGWDMRRKLEVDFASGDGTGIGEAIFVIDCGLTEGVPASVRRLVRGGVPAESATPTGALTPVPRPAAGTVPSHSIFGLGGHSLQAVDGVSHGDGTQSAPQLATPRLDVAPTKDMEEWRCTEFTWKKNSTVEITASAIDQSNFAVLAAFEDPLHSGPRANGANVPSTPTSRHATGEIPGRRGRLMAIGTNAGTVIVWNMRDHTSMKVTPTRVIQTESPGISSLGLSALYLVHGGSDGLVQAWDPLASSLEPIRTLNAKPSGRIPRHILNVNPALQHANYFAVSAVYLDPDPTVLRGIVSFGTFLRSWTYSSSNQGTGRKRRHRHSNVHGRPASRRDGSDVSSYIAAEEAELRRDEEHRSRELERMRKRFGVGLGDLTEEEAILYAQMISEESFMMDVQRRTSSDTGSTGDSASLSGSSIDTATPEPSLSGLGGPASSSLLPPVQEVDNDDDYEAQIQRAIRLSLMEGVNSDETSPGGYSYSGGDFDFEVKVKTGGNRAKKGKGKRSTSVSPIDEQRVQFEAASSQFGSADVDTDADLALALSLSLEEEERARRAASGAGGEEFPPLDSKGKGKGKWA